MFFDFRNQQFSLSFRRWIVLIALLFAWDSAMGGLLSLPKNAFEPAEIAVIVNDRDPLSLRIGRYYVEKRKIPPNLLIHVSFAPDRGNLPLPQFKKVFAKVAASTPPSVQAYALTWARPFRVGCMSITTAFATGYDRLYCAAKETLTQPCGITARSPYFDSTSEAPFRDYHLRPAIALAAFSFEDAKRLIDRGVQSDGSFPKGTAYLLETSDRNRSVRSKLFPLIKKKLGDRIPIQILKQDSLRHRNDVLFYFTGKIRVEGLETLKFLPGAIADHLTSAGGIMTPAAKPGNQMSALRWLEAGATGSFGTVVEPCNYLTKFPHPGVVMENYLNGATLIEAYWKSVAWPGEGLFIGEPLARPFGTDRSLRVVNGQVQIQSGALAPGVYDLLTAPFAPGPYQNTGQRVTIERPGQTILLKGLKAPYYQLQRINARPVKSP